MIRFPLTAITAALALAGPLHAQTGDDVARVIADHVLPGTARFADGAAALARATQAGCRPEPATLEAYQAAFDDWMGISHLRFGPLEVDGRVTAIAFWPDARGFTPRQLAGLIADQDPAVDSADDFAHVSVAARGLFALEQLLFDPQFAGYGAGDYTCRLVQAVAVDLARMAAAIDHDWREDQAPLMQSAGAPGNTAYLGPDEAARQLYTALLTGLEFTADARLGRPLGTFDRPRATRAEARRAMRSQRNVILSLEATRDLARALAGDVAIPLTEAAYTDALERAQALDDPDFAGVDDPIRRLRVEIVQQRVQAVRRAIEGEIGAALGLSAGFNSADGD